MKKIRRRVALMLAMLLIFGLMPANLAYAVDVSSDSVQGKQPVEQEQGAQDGSEYEDAEVSAPGDKSDSEEEDADGVLPDEALEDSDPAGMDLGKEETPENPWLEAMESFALLISKQPVYGVLHLENPISIRKSPAEDAAISHSLAVGYQAKLTGFEVVNNQAWYEVEFGIKDTAQTGFVKNGNFISDDIRFREWKDTYGIDGLTGLSRGISPMRSTNLSEFPESYRPYIQSMMNARPNWTFVPFHTGLDWNSVISNQMHPSRNLVPLGSPASWKVNDHILSAPNWVQASEAIVRYYMDPRNFLNETSVFQFELLSFHGTAHTVAGVEAILAGTFMGNSALNRPGENGTNGGMTYAQVFWEAGRDFNVSPYFLASRIRQEQGTGKDETGNIKLSRLITGNENVRGVDFRGLYNYFNMGASGITMDDIVFNGLTEARTNGWTSRYAALRDGADRAANKYIRRGQDTLYLQKFDVDGSYDGLFWHQYMQNLLAADNEGKKMRDAYAAVGNMNNSFVFKVPVYNNMPPVASYAPETPPGTVYNGVDYAAVYSFEFYITKYPDLRAAFGNNSADALRHFVNAGMYEGRQGSANFNVISYKLRYADLRMAFGNNLPKYYMHFINAGVKEGRIGIGTTTVQNPITTMNGINYGAVYEFNFYSTKYRDLQNTFGQNDVAMLEHFVNAGMREGRQGKSTFSVSSYRLRYQDLRLAFGNDLKAYYTHFVNAGAREGRQGAGTNTVQNPVTRMNGVDYSAVYNFAQYSARYRDLQNAFGQDDIAMLSHFVNAGMREGRMGSSAFDINSYRLKYRDLRLTFGNDLPRYYLHYINTGKREGRAATGTTTMQDPVTVMNGINYGSVYDFNYYLGKYADLKKAFGADDIAMLAHFVNAGMREGRQASTGFNVSYYRNNYMDLERAFGNNLPLYYMHYIRTGRNEGRVANRRL